MQNSQGYLTLVSGYLRTKRLTKHGTWESRKGCDLQWRRSWRRGYGLRRKRRCAVDVVVEVYMYSCQCCWWCYCGGGADVGVGLSCGGCENSIGRAILDIQKENNMPQQAVHFDLVLRVCVCVCVFMIGNMFLVINNYFNIFIEFINKMKYILYSLLFY